MEQHASHGTEQHSDTEPLSDQVTATPSKHTLIDSLGDLRVDGWVSFQDRHQPLDGSEQLSFVLVGPGGIVVLETASSLVTDQRQWLTTGAGRIAATLQPAHRATVRTAIVVPNTDADDPAAVVPVLTVDSLPLFLRSLPNALSQQDQDVLVKQLRAVRPKGEALTTTADLLPVAEGLNEELLRAAATRANRRRPLFPAPKRRRPKGSKHHPAGRARHARGTRLTQTHLRPELSTVDMLRIALVTFSCLVGMWFWGTLTNAVSGTEHAQVRPTTTVTNTVSPNAIIPGGTTVADTGSGAR